MYDNMLSRFHAIPERNGRTDRHTDRYISYINIARQYAELLTRDKNGRQRTYSDITNKMRVLHALQLCYAAARGNGDSQLAS